MREMKLKSNMLGIDEPFSTVPEESVNIIMSLVKAMADSKSLHVIAHSKMLDASEATFIDVTGGIIKSSKKNESGLDILVNVPAKSILN